MLSDTRVDIGRQSQIENAIAVDLRLIAVHEFGGEFHDFGVELLEALCLFVAARQVAVKFHELGEFSLFALSHLHVLVRGLGEHFVDVEFAARIAQKERFGG